MKDLLKHPPQISDAERNAFEDKKDEVNAGLIFRGTAIYTLSKII